MYVDNSSNLPHLYIDNSPNLARVYVDNRPNLAPVYVDSRPVKQSRRLMRQSPRPTTSAATPRYGRLFFAQ